MNRKWTRSSSESCPKTIAVIQRRPSACDRWAENRKCAAPKCAFSSSARFPSTLSTVRSRSRVLPQPILKIGHRVPSSCERPLQARCTGRQCPVPNDDPSNEREAKTIRQHSADRTFARAWGASEPEYMFELRQWRRAIRLHVIGTTNRDTLVETPDFASRRQAGRARTWCRWCTS